MKRIEIMAKMDEQNVAEEIIGFLQDHDLVDKINAWHDGKRLGMLFTDLHSIWERNWESDTE